jgi:hypothetical protein
VDNEPVAWLSCCMRCNHEEHTQVKHITGKGDRAC